MPTLPKVLYRGAASTTTTTVLYTVPTISTTTILTNILVANTTGTNGTFTITIDGVDIATAVTVTGNSVALFDLKQVIPANATPKVIRGGASATTINLHLSGVEIS